MTDEGQPIANEGAAPEGQAPTGAADPGTQEASYDIDGEKVPVSKIKEWKSGNLMQADYTRKTTELADQRRQLDPYIQAKNWSDQNPDKWGEVQQIINRGQGQANNDYIDPEVQKVASENQRLKSQLTNVQLKVMMNEVKQDPKYAGAFNDPFMENTLLEKMLASPDVNSNPNVHKEAAEKLHSFMNKSRAKAILEGEDKVKKELNGRPAAGKGTMSPPATFDPGKASKKELRNAAIDMLG